MDRAATEIGKRYARSCNLIQYGFNSGFKGSPLIQNDKNVKSPKRSKKIEPEPNLEFGAILGNRQLILTLPLRTQSPNMCEPWQKRHARHKEQKRAVMFAMIPYRQIITMPCTIKCIRFAKKEIDKHDNLPMSFKNLVDCVAAEITGDHRPGLADSNKGFTFQYDQVKSKKYYVKIEISW